MDITLQAGTPATEFSQDFVQGMANRMSLSYLKYGRVREAYPDKVDAIASLRARLRKYEETGNTEHLIDLANFAMIEFMCPGHPKAHFKAEDSAGSPGRKWHGNPTLNQRPNDY